MRLLNSLLTGLLYSPGCLVRGVSRRLGALLAFLALAGAALPAHALDPAKSFHHYVRTTWSIQSGLPQISVQAIVQDHQGFIWVATQAGVARFDGVRFTTFTPGNEPALQGIWIRSLLVDSAGRLWIGSYKGLTLYQNGVFTAIAQADPAQYPLIDVNAMVEQDGKLVVATSSGIFDLVGGKLAHRADSPAPATALLKSADGIWVGSLGGVHRPQGRQWALIAMPDGSRHGAVTRLAEAQGKIWVGTSLGLMTVQEDQENRDGARSEPAGQTDGQDQLDARAAAEGAPAARARSAMLVPATNEPMLKNSPTTLLYQDSDQNLWVASNAGLGRLRDGVLFEISSEKNPLSIKGVIAAFEDRERNLWMGSHWAGLTRLWNGATRRLAGAEGLQEPIVWSVARAQDGRMWVGTNDGLSLFANGRFQQILRGDQLPHPHVYNMLVEGETVWIGTRSGLVQWRDGKLATPPDLAKLAEHQINGIVRGKGGMVWIATSNGLFRLEDHILRRYGKPEGLSDVRIRMVRELKDGRLLVATQAGLFELRGERLEPLGLDNGLRPNLDVTAVAELRDGALVIGTLTEEIFLLSGKQWRKFGRTEGFPANTPFFFAEDAGGFLWAAGLRGITRVALSEMARVVHGKASSAYAEMILNERGDRRSGEQGFCCNGAGNSKGLLDPDGVLWLPSRDGVVTLDTRRLTKNAVAPTAVIERIRVQDAWREVRPGQALALDQQARDLAFEFTALSFQDPASVVLRYRLHGYDKEWRELPANAARAVNYTNLPAGAYTFEVKASNNADVWNKKPALLEFRIAPHFYETGWFYGLLAAALAAAIYGGYRLQRRAHLKQRAALEQQVTERTEQLHIANLALELASQTDPLTGLHNRRYLGNQIPADLAFYERENKRTGTTDNTLLFALVDIDHFKRINDTYGHRAGDRVLQQVADVLRAQVRTGDYIVRWGGEEFLLVCRPSVRHFVAILGERVRQALARHVFDLGDGIELSLTCSIGLSESGVYMTRQHQVKWEQLIELADTALYWVKENGRNGWAALRPAPDVDHCQLIEKLHLGAQALVDSGKVTLLNSKTLAPESPPAPPAPPPPHSPETALNGARDLHI